MRRRLAASLLLLVLATPVLPAVPTGDAPMACCLTDGSCECRTVAGLTRCPSESGSGGMIAPQRLPSLVAARITVTPPSARPISRMVDAPESPSLPDEPSVPPPRA